MPPVIIVIGAGPAGLAAGYYLQRRGLPFRILEKRRVGFSWEGHYEHLHLHSPKGVSHLPGLPMPKTYPTFPSAAQFLAYLRHYAAHFRLPIEEGIEVCEVRYEDGWHVLSPQGQERAQLLLATTGIAGNAYRPHLPGEAAFMGQVLHAKSYKRPQDFRGERVLVVGAGNTAAEIAVALAREGIEVGISVRSGLQMVPKQDSVALARASSFLLRHSPTRLADALLSSARKDFSDLGLPLPKVRPSSAYPVVGFALAEEVQAKRVRVHGEIERLSEFSVHFSNGSSELYDTLIMATGYRPALGFLRDFLELTPTGWPVLERHRSTLHPKLFALGYQYPALEAWLQAIGREAKGTVARMAREYRHT